jgi:hypothetical protein
MFKNKWPLLVFMGKISLSLDKERVIKFQIFLPMTDDNQESALSTCFSKFKFIFES